MKTLFLLINVFVVSISLGQIIDPFTIRFQINQKGSIKMLSNVSVGCACSAHNEMPPAGVGDNNWFSAEFVDVDIDSTTFMSSSDQLNLANCSQISWAGLYWLGRLNSGNPSLTAHYAIRDQIKLSIDGSAYTDLTADELYDNTVGKVSYFAFKDITSIMQANTIYSEYTVANVVSETGVNAFGGWTIVVVYKNVFESSRNLTVFDGLANVTQGTSGIVNISLSGFVTPPTGPVSFELGVVAHDGDRSQSGDQLDFNGAGSFVNISDPIHPINNVFNSTISNGGILTPLRNPNYDNTLGHDANIYAPDNSGFNYIGNATTSSTIRVSTNSETVLTSVITSAIDIYEPDFQSSVSYQDFNGGTVLPGDILEYKIVSKNIGSDNSVNTFLIDTLDQRLIYLPGTLEITYGPNSGIKTDLIDSDQAEFIVADNVIQARIGTGANGTSGGILMNSPTGSDSTILTFQAQLLNDCPVWQCGETLNNRVYLFGTGQTSDNLNSNDGISDELNAEGCPSLETGIVNVDLSTCAELTIDYTDSLCVGDTLSFSFTNSQNLDYLWSGPNGFISTVSDPSIPNVQLIDSGLYTLQIIYSGVNCLADTNVFVFVSDNPIIQLNNIINANCFNSNTGLINISGVGNGEFNYEWSNNDQDFITDGLGAGTYSVIVTDQYGCSISDTFNITEPADILLTETSINPSCQLGTQGSIDLTVTGGTPDYYYSWNNNQIAQDINGLYAGQYLVFVTDTSGCQDSLVIQLNDPDALVLSEIHTDVLCYSDSTGIIDLTVSNGIPNYSYAWGDGQMTEDVINLPFGNYFVNVTDQNNCGAFLSVFIAQPDTLLFLTDSNVTHILCFDESSGLIDIEVDGGVIPYTFQWDNGDTTMSLINIPTGNYTLTITDANGCFDTLSITVNQPLEPLSLAGESTSTCLGDSSGTIIVFASGGTPGYFYIWDTKPGHTLDYLFNLPIDTYLVIVTDLNDCVDSLHIKVNQLTSLNECVNIEMPNVFTPNNDMINDVFLPRNLFNIKTYNLVIVNRWGETMFESSVPSIGWNGTFMGKPCNEGVYFYSVNYTDNYDENGKIHGYITLNR